MPSAIIKSTELLWVRLEPKSCGWCLDMIICPIYDSYQVYHNESLNIGVKEKTVTYDNYLQKTLFQPIKIGFPWSILPWIANRKWVCQDLVNPIIQSYLSNNWAYNIAFIFSTSR